MTKGVSHLFHVDLEGSAGLALGAGPRPSLLVLSLVERTEDEPATETVVLDHAQLGEDVGGGRHDAAGPD